MTYATMRNRISDEVAGVTPPTATTAPSTSQINSAIQSAIAHYQRQPFYFNESRDETFSTVADQEFYGTSDNAAIPNIASIDALTITVNGVRTPLERLSWEAIDTLLSTTTDTGAPWGYCYYDQQIRLVPIPDAVYSVRISGNIRMTALSADGDTNAWMTDAEELIRARASWDLFRHVLNEDQRAQACQATEAMALQALRIETTQRASSGRIKGTGW